MSHWAGVRGPVSYRIHFVVYRSFLTSPLPTTTKYKGQEEGQALSKKFQYFSLIFSKHVWTVREGFCVADLYFVDACYQYISV